MAGQDIFYYPDAMVACDPADNHRHYREHPTVLVEVISESTRRVDIREKLSTYISIPSLREYVMIAQDSVEATVLRRDRDWKPQVLTNPEGILEVPSIGFSIPLREIYAEVFHSS